MQSEIYFLQALNISQKCTLQPVPKSVQLFTIALLSCSVGSEGFSPKEVSNLFIECDKRTHTMLKYYDKAMCSNNIQHNMTE